MNRCICCLEKKWIEPLIEGLKGLPDTLVDTLVSKISALQTKYDTTLDEIEAPNQGNRVNTGRND